MAIHQGFYNYLVYATKEGFRVRPFATGGGHFSNFVPPGVSVTQGGGVDEVRGELRRRDQGARDGDVGIPAGLPAVPDGKAVRPAAGVGDDAAERIVGRHRISAAIDRHGLGLQLQGRCQKHTRSISRPSLTMRAQ
jgi:hypothetical protein